MSTILKNQKLISVRVPQEIANFLKQKAEEDGRTVSNYLKWLVMREMEETEFLLSLEENKKMLLKSKNQAEKGIYSIKNLQEN